MDSEYKQFCITVLLIEILQLFTQNIMLSVIVLSNQHDFVRFKSNCLALLTHVKFKYPFTV